MTKIDRFLTIIFLAICSIIIIGVLIFSDNVADKVLAGVIAIGWLMLFSRSFHLENYLRKLDSLEKIRILEHISGLLNNFNNTIGLLVVVKPILDRNEFQSERRKINLLTGGIYIIFSVMIFIIMKFI